MTAGRRRRADRPEPRSGGKSRRTATVSGTAHLIADARWKLGEVAAAVDRLEAALGPLRLPEDLREAWRDLRKARPSSEGVSAEQVRERWRPLQDLRALPAPMDGSLRAPTPRPSGGGP